ncbi:MAG: ArsR/SmtB family transcription factor [Bacilli bacterium]
MIELNKDEITDLSEFYKIFGDPTRIKILLTLIKSSKTVSAIINEVNMSQSAVSHQLQLLRSYRIVKSEREGKFVIYSLDDDHVLSTLLQGIEHIKHG